MAVRSLLFSLVLFSTCTVSSAQTIVTKYDSLPVWKPIGFIYFDNQTGEKFRLTARSGTDAFGKKVAVDWNWDVNPSDKGRVIANKMNIMARGFEFSVTTEEGTSYWTSQDGQIDTNMNYRIEFTKDDMKKHRETFVKSKAEPKSSVGQPVGQRAPTQEELNRAAVKIVGAVVAHIYAESDPEDLLEAFAQQFAAKLGDELIESAFMDVIPNLTQRQAKISRHVLMLILSGKLDIQSLSEKAAKVAISEAIKEYDPNLDALSDVAQLTYKACVRFQNTRRR
jgi:hypothetical protein